MKSVGMGLVIALALGLTPSLRAQGTAADTALRSYGELMVGGVWKTTLDDGSQIEQQFHWILDNHFVESTEKGNAYSAKTLIGIDPETSRTTIWRFATSGSVLKVSLTQEKDGVWLWQMADNHTPDGKISGKGRITKLENDKVLIEWLEFLKNGEQQDVLPPATFTRQK